MIKLLIIAGIVVVLAVVYFLFVGLMPGFKVPKLSLAGKKETSRLNIVSGRKDVGFVVKGNAISAWLYRPPDTGDGKVPCVVMANGTGGTKDMLLEAYARRFQAAGLAVLSFDYRFFGESEGEPRQLLWIPCQLEDYAAAVDFTRNLEGIDTRRIALWGTSLSGGHVITAAARDHGIACAVAQCPGVDGRASAKHAFETMGISHMLRMVVHGQRDWVRGFLGLAPHQIPVASARETEKLLGKYADAHYYPFGHFDIYRGKHFERAVAEQIEFLQKHLGIL